MYFNVQLCPHHLVDQSLFTLGFVKNCVPEDASQSVYYRKKQILYCLFHSLRESWRFFSSKDSNRWAVEAGAPNSHRLTLVVDQRHPCQTHFLILVWEARWQTCIKNHQLPIRVRAYFNLLTAKL